MRVPTDWRWRRYQRILGAVTAEGRRALQPLAKAGLTRLTISYDDAHAEFVARPILSTPATPHAGWGVEVLIAVVREPGAKIDARYMEMLLDLPKATTR